MSRRVRSSATLVVAVVLTLLSGLAPASTTTASASTFIYDAQSNSRVDVLASGGTDVGPAPFTGTGEWSASPSVEARGTSTTPNARSVATEAEGSIPGLSTSEQRAVNSLEQRVAEHQAKLEAYQADPFANDNLGILERAPSAEIQQSIIDGRIRHLQNEIQAFQDQIDKLLGGRS